MPIENGNLATTCCFKRASAVIPTEIETAMLRQRGTAVRSAGAKVEEELEAIGVHDASQFGEFFRRFSVVSVLDHASGPEMVDLLDPTPQIRLSTEFAQEVYGVPRSFIALTSGEGEGFFLYNKTSEAVYEVDVNQVNDLAAERTEPRWPDFFSFLRWYLKA